MTLYYLKGLKIVYYTIFNPFKQQRIMIALFQSILNPLHQRVNPPASRRKYRLEQNMEINQSILQYSGMLCTDRFCKKEYNLLLRTHIQCSECWCSLEVGDNGSSPCSSLHAFHMNQALWSGLKNRNLRYTIFNSFKQQIIMIALFWLILRSLHQWVNPPASILSHDQETFFSDISVNKQGLIQMNEHLHTVNITLLYAMESFVIKLPYKKILSILFAIEKQI